MCGIVGIMSTEGLVNWDRRKKFLQQSLYADAVRGWDSTGVFAGGKVDQETYLYKRALNAHDFLPQTGCTRLVSNVDKYPFIIGHNRAATKGSVSDLTAHPFDFSNVIGVHNGTIYNHRKLPQGNNFIVDSEAIFNALNNGDPEEVIEELEGAFALVWMDKRDNTLRMVRNDERPLSIAYMKNEDTVLLASEGPMLRWLAHRNGFEVERLEAVRPGELYTFHKDDLGKPVRKKVKLFVKKSTYTQHYGNQAGHGSQYNQNWEKRHQNWKNGRHGTGQHKRSYKNSSEILGGMGRKLDDKIQFVVKSFITYQGNLINGRAEGFIEREPYLQVFLHSAPLKQFSTHKPGTYWLCEGEIANAYSEDDYLDTITIKNATVLNKVYKPLDITINQNKVLVDSKGNALVEDKKEGSQPSGVKSEDKDGNERTEKGSTKTSETEENRKAFEVSVFYGRKGEEISREEWDNLTKHGCCHCAGNVMDWETGGIAWTAEGDPLCTTCVTSLNYENLIPRKYTH